MLINVQFDTNKDDCGDILNTICMLLGKDNIEIKKSVSVSEARKKLRILAKLGKMQLAQELVDKYCGGSIDGAPEASYEKLVLEIDKIIN